MGDHFENAADRIARSQNFVYFFLHLLFGFGIGAIQKNLIDFAASGRESAPTAPLDRW